MKICWFVLALCLSIPLQAAAASIIDNRTVCNPNLNSCVKVFDEEMTDKTRLVTSISEDFIAEARQYLMNWIYEGSEATYLRDFDSSRFHFQFIQKASSSEQLGIVMIIPEGEIGAEFYSDLAAGLEVPGTRCVDANWVWLNDGEIFSWVYDRESKSLGRFRNWRFEQEKETGIDPMTAYYSLLTIHYKCKNNKAEETTIVQFVNGELRTEVPAWENYPVMLPKGKISTLVFYCEGQIKGVLCFDMTSVSRGCPLRYESTVYMKDRLGYERILYAKPQCEGIYPISLIQKEKFEELTSLSWDVLSDFKEEVAYR